MANDDSGLWAGHDDVASCNIVVKGLLTRRSSEMTRSGFSFLRGVSAMFVTMYPERLLLRPATPWDDLGATPVSISTLCIGQP